MKPILSGLAFVQVAPAKILHMSLRQTRINRIAFVNLDGQLETISPDGDNQRVLSQANRFFQFPTWSPNGNAIASVGGNRSNAGVFVFADQSNFSPSTGHEVFNQRGHVPIYLNWSPNSQYLSFIAIMPPQQSFGLHVLPAPVFGDGAPTSQSANENAMLTLAVGRPCFWDWSPNSDQILLHMGFAGEDNARLAFISPNKNQSARQSDDIAPPGYFQSPGIARSGNYWAFAHLHEGRSQLVIDGRGMDERITLDHHGLVAMGWNPNPALHQLAFISPPGPARTSYGALHVVDAEGSGTQLTDDTVIAFFWSPDGRKIAYFTVAAVYEQLRERVGLGRASYEVIAESTLNGGLIQEPTQNDTRTLRLNVWVADVAENENTLLYTFQPPDVFVQQLLPFFDQYALSHRIWSPDSDAIVLSELDGDDACLTVVPTNTTRAPYAIGRGLMPFWSWQ